MVVGNLIVQCAKFGPVWMPAPGTLAIVGTTGVARLEEANIGASVAETATTRGRRRAQQKEEEDGKEQKDRFIMHLKKRVHVENVNDFKYGNPEFI